MGKASLPAFFAPTLNVSMVHCAIVSLAIAFSVFQKHLRHPGTRQARFYDGSPYLILRFILRMRTDKRSLVAGASIFAEKVLSNMFLTVNVILMPHSIKAAVGIGQLHTGQLLFGADHSNKSLQQ